jgi:hypothetical protein
MTLKSRDKCGRWRNKTVAFRMSPEENESLDLLVAISGLTKQDYITKRLLQREMIVVPSSRVQKALRNNMLLVYGELMRIRNASQISADLEEIIQSLSEIFSKLGCKDFTPDTEQTEQAIQNLDRG